MIESKKMCGIIFRVLLICVLQNNNWLMNEKKEETVGKIKNSFGVLK